jgi:hypothetical protein
MTSGLFATWLKGLDARMASAKRKIALVLDNVSSHISCTLQNVALFYLPANTTSMTQPLDQGIIRSFKVHYRKAMLSKLLTQIDSIIDANSAVKNISILDAIHMIEKAWDDVAEETITSCFQKAGVLTKEYERSSVENVAEDVAELKGLTGALGITCTDDTILADNNAETCLAFDNPNLEEDIVQELMEDEAVEEEIPEEVSAMVEKKALPIDEAYQMYSGVLRSTIYKEFPELMSAHEAFVIQLEEAISKRKVKNLKQTKIDSFFNKLQ